jgi:cell division protein FtsL
MTKKAAPMYYDLTLDNTSRIQTKKSGWSISPFVRNIFILGLTAVFLLFYIVEINMLGTKTYDIKKIEVKIKQLEVENKHLQMQASSLQSINRIQLESQKINFVPAGSVTYINDSGVAFVENANPVK